MGSARGSQLLRWVQGVRSARRSTGLLQIWKLDLLCAREQPTVAAQNHGRHRPPDRLRARSPPPLRLLAPTPHKRGARAAPVRRVARRHAALFARRAARWRRNRAVRGRGAPPPRGRRRPRGGAPAHGDGARPLAHRLGARPRARVLRARALCHDSGRLAESAGWYRKSAHAVEARLGPNHAALVAPLHNEGIALARLGRFDDARAALARAADLAGSVLGVGGLHALRADLVAALPPPTKQRRAAARRCGRAGVRSRREHRRRGARRGGGAALCRVGLAELLQQAGGEKTRRDRTADHERAFDLLGAQRAALRTALAAEPPESARLSDELAHCAGRARRSPPLRSAAPSTPPPRWPRCSRRRVGGATARARARSPRHFVTLALAPFTLQSASNGASPSAAADGPAAPLSLTE